jgi:Leucine rich repeat
VGIACFAHAWEVKKMNSNQGTPQHDRDKSKSKNNSPANSYMGMPSFFNFDFLETETEDSHRDKEVIINLPLDVCDSKFRCLKENDIPGKVMGPQNSCCSTMHGIGGPPSWINGSMKEEDVSVLSFEGALHEKFGNFQSPHVHPEPIIGRGMIESIENQALCFPLNVCNAPSYVIDMPIEEFEKESKQENISDVLSLDLQNSIDFEKNRITLKRERERLQKRKENQAGWNLNVHDPLFQREHRNYEYFRVCESGDDSVPMQLLEAQSIPPNSKEQCQDNEKSNKKRTLMPSMISKKKMCPFQINVEWKTLRQRKFGFLLLCIVVVTIFIVLVFTLSAGENEDKNDEPSRPDSLPCDDATNIFPECSCQDRLPRPISDSVISTYTLMTDFLSRTGAIKNSTLFTASPLSCTPENQAILWISEYNNKQQGINEVLQRYLLAVIHQLLNGHDWMRSAKWLSSESVCEWEGIVCTTPSYDISELNMVNNSLSGALPNNELKMLTSMRKLRMDHNPKLSGTLSSELMELPSLHTISFSSTNLSGNIPSRIGNNVTELLLSSTSLTGSLPTELGHVTSLRKLDMRGNQISGAIPTEVGNLPHLEYIDLSWNKLSGTVIYNWNTTFLNTLLIDHNKNLMGEFPEPPSSLLIRVNYAHTSLNGMVSEEYCKLKFLESVTLDCANGTNVGRCPCCRCVKPIRSSIERSYHSSL